MSAPSAATAAARAKRAEAARLEADAMLGRVPRGKTHEVVTPEGVPIRFTIGSAGERATAFVLDAMILVAGIIALLLLVGASGVSIDSWVGAVVFVLLFLLRQAYFTWFEARPRAATPGKRAMGLRVIERSGGPLTAEAVITRNLTRDVEVWLPLIALIAPDAFFPGMPGALRWLAVAWLLLFALMPLFNRQRLRVGDLVAGTMVVAVPKASLLADVGRERATQAVPAPAPARPGRGGVADAVLAAAAGGGPGAPAPLPLHAFADAQLDVYGIFELQVLEDVLRRSREGSEQRAALDAVASKIRKKIAWPKERAKEPAEPFLRDFYAALRGRLERRMLLGKRKEDKFSK